MLIDFVSCLEMGKWANRNNMKFSFSSTFEEANLMLISPCLNMKHLDGLVLLSLMM
jgi:hypothetical protein